MSEVLLSDLYLTFVRLIVRYSPSIYSARYKVKTLCKGDIREKIKLSLLSGTSAA